MVRAKFRVETKSPDGQEISLRPVVSGSPENEDFYKYTPGGDIRLNILNEKASAQFEVGKEYYVDFTKVE